jgi:preprotein translocase subunit SecG
MQTVLIVIHLMIVVALVGVVLLQRSEGGALGMGGGGNGGFMSARGAADTLTRTTSILAAAFSRPRSRSAFWRVTAKTRPTFSTGCLRKIQQDQDGTTPVPTQNGVLDMLGAPDEAPAETTETPSEPSVPNN